MGVRSFIFSDKVIEAEEQPLQDRLSFPLKGLNALLWVKRSKFSQLYTWTTERKSGDFPHLVALCQCALSVQHEDLILIL